MNDIGRWARRSRTDRNRQTSKWHRIESEVAGDVITTCGRRMARVALWRQEGLWSPLGNRLEIVDIYKRYGAGGSMNGYDILLATCIQCQNARS